MADPKSRDAKSQSCEANEVDKETLAKYVACTEMLEGAESVPSSCSYLLSQPWHNEVLNVKTIEWMISGAASWVNGLPYRLVLKEVVPLLRFIQDTGMKIYAMLARSGAAVRASELDADMVLRMGDLALMQFVLPSNQEVIVSKNIVGSFVGAFVQLDVLGVIASMMATLGQNWFVGFAAKNQVSAPGLAEQAMEAMYMNFLRGSALEFAATNLTFQYSLAEAIVEGRVSEDDGRPDYQHVFPWPRDLRCYCGMDLRPAIFCCNVEKPIDVQPFIDDPNRPEKMRRPCCGEEYRGFRCDVCGRIYDWNYGIVASVGGQVRN